MCATDIDSRPYVCHRYRFTTICVVRICSVYRNHNPVLSPIMAYHQVCNKNNTTGATCGVGTAYPSGVPAFTPGFKGGPSCSIFSFLCNVL